MLTLGFLLALKVFDFMQLRTGCYQNEMEGYVTSFVEIKIHTFVAIAA